MKKFKLSMDINEPQKANILFSYEMKGGKKTGILVTAKFFSVLFILWEG